MGSKETVLLLLIVTHECRRPYRVKAWFLPRVTRRRFVKETALCGLKMAALTKNESISSIGNNFKGVMLCNRPCEGESVPFLVHRQSESIHSNNGGSFICGTVKKPWGRNVVISEKARVLCRLSHKESALSKHKKWLWTLQKERENCELSELQEQKDKDSRMREFKEREARKRERVLSSVEDEIKINTEFEGSALEEENEKRGASSPQHTCLLDKELTESECHHVKRKQKNHKRDDGVNLSLPAWAMTESKTELLEAESVQLEQDELLSFADGLDYEKFENDLELGLLMNKVKERIRALEKERQREEAKLRRIEESEIAAKSIEFNKVDTFNSLKIEEPIDSSIENGDDEDVRSIAGTVISSKNGLMGYIHSRKSAEALVHHAKERLDTNKISSFNPLDIVAEEEVDLVEERKCSPPASITHKDDEGARLALMKSLQKLPFMNRNPAV